jgi:uncharacterized membrane protein YhaH (DUF805 family)
MNPRHPLLLSLASIGALLIGASCSPDLASVAERMTTPSERAFAAGYLGLLAAGQLDSAYGLLSPSLRNEDARSALAPVAEVLGQAHLDSLEPIGVNIGVSPESRMVNLSYEMPTTSAKWAVANVATETVAGHVTVVGVSAYLVPARLELLHAFTLAGKPAKQYAWLVLAVLMPLVCMAIAISILRTRDMPRRWLWALLALVATPVFSISWTGGESGVQAFSFLLLGASATRPSPASPWSIAWAVPTGALVAYFHLRTWRARRPPPTDVAV